jgi:hypothetical protein
MRADNEQRAEKGEDPIFVEEAESADSEVCSRLLSSHQ